MTDLTTQAREMIDRLEGAFHQPTEPSAYKIAADATALIRNLLAEREAKARKDTPHEPV